MGREAVEMVAVATEKVGKVGVVREVVASVAAGWVVVVKGGALTATAVEVVVATAAADLRGVVVEQGEGADAAAPAPP